MMDRSNMEHFKDMLFKQGRDVEKTINNMKVNKSGEQDKFSNNELSSYDNHPAELGSEVYLTTMNNALRVHQEHILKEIHDALDRIEKGTYGKCAFCGDEISYERLEALPYARLCIKCEESKEVTPRVLDNERPVEELIWDAPFGRKYLNRREDDEHEGMDYFNDLMKYGSADSPQDLGGYHDYEEFYTNEIDQQGIVDDMDRVTNDEYKRQLPD
ncbi:TraR/DksA C4-type zinc finger protein [Clostridium thermosuccinogenes]|nr:TraR/DksA C4-type zinc finger protein [Pseudoclostridium thermosuccinogenes]